MSRSHEMSTRSLRSHARALSEDPDQGQEADQQDTGEATLDKEQMIWDAFREEHYEAIEQMPLTLHRQYTLMRELDQQAQGHLQKLQPALHHYIGRRQNMAHPEPPPNPDNQETDAPNSPRPHSAAPSTPRTPTSVNGAIEQPLQGMSTRQLLSYIARISEELSAASEEKVNLAQAACDSVDRQIRQIDQAIKEQEAAISLGNRHGSTLAPVILPDLVAVTRWSRATHVAISDDDDDEAAGAVPINDQGAAVLGVASSPEETGKKRQRRASKSKAQPKAPDTQTFSRSDRPRRDSRALKILPPKAPGKGDKGPDIYCFCRRAINDNLIGCDNRDCKTEWFHWSCVGVTKEPEGDWFCPECGKSKSRRRK